MSARLKGIVVLGLVAVTAGCSPASPEPAASPEQQKTTTQAALAASTQARELILPFDAYKISKAEDYRVAAAEDVLMEGCLKAESVRWTPRTPVRAAETDPPNRRRYGVIEDAVAREFGFHAPPDPVAEVRFTTGREQRANSLDEDEWRAAYGSDGAGGCWKRAHERLLEGVPKSDYNVINRYSRQVFEDSQRDGEVREVFRAWSVCMKKDGFRYDDPTAAANDSRWGRSATPSARETEAARADVRCKEETGVVTVWAAAEARNQRAVIAAHAADFRALKATKDAHLAAARRVLDTAAG